MAAIKLSKSEVDKIQQLREKLTGSKSESNAITEFLVNNVKRIMYRRGFHSLDELLANLELSPQDKGELISALSIHTTSWFREVNHFKVLEEILHKDKNPRELSILSIGCSTGEEVYSIGTVMEKCRREAKIHDYRIIGVDIDPVSLKIATKAIYQNCLDKIPDEYREFFLSGTNQASGKMTVIKDIRDRAQFLCGSILELKHIKDRFDYIFCRNILIYFNEEQVTTITEQMRGILNDPGYLFIGHTETVAYEEVGIQSLGSSVYFNSRSGQVPCLPTNRKTVKTQLPKTKPDIILVGASTGGPQALWAILGGMPKNSPPICIVLHFPVKHNASFASRLEEHSGLKVVLVNEKTPLERGTIYLAGGDHHLVVAEYSTGLFLKKDDSPPVNEHRPAVDPLFLSGATVVKKAKVMAFILTGMGSDGAKGMLELRSAGHETIAQNSESCVVFGMPKKAIELGAAKCVLGLDEIKSILHKT